MPVQENDLAQYNRYISETFASEDSVLAGAKDAMEKGGLPKINVSSAEGKLLHVLALSIGARRILEVGTLGGYSAIWLARALPDGGKLISLELDAHHAEVASANIAEAGLSHKVEIRVGPALESLNAMAAQGEAAFDLAFIDADKDGYVDYLHATIPLVRAGGLILGDNTLPDSVWETSVDTGTKRYNSAVAGHAGLTSALAPILREKGIDGLTISVVSH